MNTSLDTTGLLKPQIKHSYRLLDSIYLNGIACDLSETGTGKTYCGSWIAKQFNGPIVVIGPKSSLHNWKGILENFGVKPAVLINLEKLMRGGTPYVKFRKPGPVIDRLTGKPVIDPKTQKPKVNKWKYQLVDCFFPSGCLIIIDESHKCKGTTSLNAGLLIALKRQGYKVLTLSATQATNPLDMRAFGYATNLHDLYSWKQWCIDHGAEEDEQYGNLKFNSDSVESYKKMTQCHHNLFNVQSIASRLTRDEMGSLFPENQIIAQAYDLGSNSSKIQSVYDEMMYEISRLEKQTENYSGHVFAEIMKARRKAELLKIPLLEDMFIDLYDEGKSIVVFLNFTESIEALGSRLENNPKLKNKIGYFYGDMAHKDRMKDLELFNADVKRGMVCNLKSGGVNLSYHDLHGKYPRVSLINPSFSAIDVYQAFGRIHRANGKTKCYQRLVFASNCIEEQICRRVQIRLNNLSFFNDGDLTSGFPAVK